MVETVGVKGFIFTCIFLRIITFLIKIYTLSECPGGHPILHQGIKLNSKNSAGIPTKMDKILVTNSSFHVKQCTTEKKQFLFFNSCLLVLTKFSFWKKDWTLGYNSMKFLDFHDVS